MSSRQASEASSAAPHRSPSIALLPEPSSLPPPLRPWKNCLPRYRSPLPKCLGTNARQYRQGMQHKVTVTLEGQTCEKGCSQRVLPQVIRFALTQRLVCSKSACIYVLLRCDSQNASAPGFLSLGPLDILGQILLCCRSCPADCRMIGSVPGLFSLDISSNQL